MEHLDRKVLAMIGAAFIAGVAVGHFAGNTLFGYQSWEECALRETKPNASDQAINHVRWYCDTLFPNFAGIGMPSPDAK